MSDQFYLLESRARDWVRCPEGTAWGIVRFVVKDPSRLPGWAKPFVEQGDSGEPWISAIDYAVLDAAQENDELESSGPPYVIEKWLATDAFESVEDAKRYGKTHAYLHEDGFRVWAVPCHPATGAQTEGEAR